MTTPPWPAPTAAGAVDATVALPGSKSLTNRYLVLAALASAPSRLRAPLRSRDTELMAAALRSLGVGVDGVATDSDSFGADSFAADSFAADNSGADNSGAHTPGGQQDWLITPHPMRGPATVDCGLAGTVMRFLPAAAALSNGEVRFDGDPRARERPMSPVLTALRYLGVRIDDDGRGGLPFTVCGTGSVPGGTVELDASASSQFVSGLLLAGARYDKGVVVHHVGKPIPSEPHVLMTVELLRDVGVTVDDTDANTWRVEPGPIGALDVQVEPDLSNAAPFLGAAVLTGGRVTVPGWPQSTTQAGDLLRDLLDEMGADVSLDRAGLTVRGTGELYGLDVDLNAAGELVPVVAALAALADSPSHLRGVAHLRGHETDRLAALTRELNALGGDVSETDDGLVIHPRPLHGGVFGTYADHRMAMAGTLVGLMVDGILVEDVETTGKTLPDFTGHWQRMLDA